MRRARSTRRLGLVLGVATLWLGAVASSAAAADSADAANVQLIVTYEDEPGRADKRDVERLGGEVTSELDLVDGLAVELPKDQVQALEDDPAVRSVEVDGTIVAFDHATNTGDLEYENAWGVEHIGAREVHLAGNTGQGLKVAIIDTGIDYVHDDPDDVPFTVDPEFDGIYAGGEDFLTLDGDPYDDNGHGTHVAGILAAAHNGYLVTGVAPGVELYALKVLGANGAGDYSGLIAALGWAVAHDIDVVNMSLGGRDASVALEMAVANAYDAGVTLVAASGNVNSANFEELLNGCPVAYPAAYPQVIAVSFTGTNDKLTGFSCTGPQVDLAAPGNQITSTVPAGPAGSCMFCSPQGYSAQSGTSMASPHVAGVAALVLHAGIADGNGDGRLGDDVRNHLCATTMPAAGMPTTDARYPNWYGCGIVDADRALLDVPPPSSVSGPDAVDDAITVAEDTPADVAVLANDSDTGGGALSVVAVTDPAHGTASINADGTVRYVPDLDATGADTFDYTIADGAGDEATATVTVTVTPSNDDPVAVADTITTLRNEPSTLDAIANDTDVDGDALVVSAVSSPAHGLAGINTDGQVVYLPAFNYVGEDAFTYTVEDGAGGVATGTVAVTVVPTNRPPLATDDMVATDEDESIAIDVLANDNDPDGGSLTVMSVTSPAHGTTTTGSAGVINYVPDADFHGSDSFDYTIEDELGFADTATVSITVTAVNDDPTAANDSTSTSEDDAVTIDVTANDSDTDGDDLTVTNVDAPGFGTATIEPDGLVTYTPAPDQTGTDSFRYTVSDGAGGTDEATVTVTVTPANDPPTATDKTVTTAYEKAVTVTMAGGDPEKCNLTFEILSAPDHGSLGSVSNVLCVDFLPPYTDSAKVKYTPDGGFSGTDSFTYRTSDGSAHSQPATVSITVGEAPTIHVGDIDQSKSTKTGSWTAIATVRVHTEAEAGRSGVTVTGTWSDGISATGTCKTTTGGCQVKLAGVPKTTTSVRFTVDTLIYAAHVYDAAENHDPDGDSDGTTIVVNGP